MPMLVDVGNEGSYNRPAFAKQAGSRSKDFAGEFDIRTCCRTLLVDIDADLVLWLDWGTIQFSFFGPAA
jgi:hypothetical protein